MSLETESQSDELLMLEYARGKMSAFDVLFARHGQKIYNFFLRQTADAELSRDLTQETWLRLIQARERYKPQTRFSNWLYTIAYNLLRDHIRKKIRRQDLEEAQMMTESGSIDAADENNSVWQERIRCAVEGLPEEQRLVLILAKYQGLSYAEIGDVLKISEAAAKQRAWRALQTLRKALKQVDGDGP